MEGDGYSVKLDFFEGPLELLLFLIKKNKIDIYDIPMAKITREYLDYLEKKDKINLDYESDFLVVAATLIYIKSQMLLPKKEEIFLEEDPREPLVTQLIEYEKIKNISFFLHKKEEQQMYLLQRPFTNEFEYEYSLQEVSLFDLAEALYSILKRKEREKVKVIEGRKVSLEEKMQEILFLLKKSKFLEFIEFFTSQSSLEESLISFFSLLELIRMKKVIALQEGLFGKIKVWPKYYFKKRKSDQN